MAKERNQVDGLLLVDKPADWTSHDVVNCIRRHFNLNKTGHCGTLDPFATGLLMILMGRATKLQDYLMAHDKIYSALARLGVATDSQDCTGEVTETREVPQLSRQDLEKTAAGFIGEQKQLPPMTSAIKINGKPLYKLARQGKTVEREPRTITISRFELLDIQLPDVAFRVHCSKGTYVRTIASDFGDRLGCGAHLQQLRREQSGSFRVDQAFSMDDIRSWELEQLRQHVIPMEKLLADLADEIEKKKAAQQG